MCESRLFQQVHGDLGCWWCWVKGDREGLGGVCGGVNIRKRLAASSLVTKIHAGEKLPRSSCRNAKTRRPASAKSVRYFCLGGLYSTSSACASAPTHTDNWSGTARVGGGVEQHAGPSQECKFPITLSNENIMVGVEEGGGRWRGHRFPL